MKKQIFVTMLATIFSLSSSAQTLEWVLNFNNIMFGYNDNVTTDNFGCVYITGLFDENIDFDPGPGVVNIIPNGSSDIFILKLDRYGNFLWVKTIGGIANEMCNHITFDKFNSIYLTGYFSGIVDFNPSDSIFNLTSDLTDDIFIVKLDTLGNFIWANSIGSNGTDKGDYLDTDASGNVYITGIFQGSVDFDPGAGVYNLINLVYSDQFVCKLDAYGNFIWARNFFPSNPSSKGNLISIDDSENVFLTDHFSGTRDLDPGTGTYNLTSNGTQDDIFICKLNSSGDFQWAKAIGNTGWDYPSSIGIDNTGNIYITGLFH